MYENYISLMIVDCEFNWKIRIWVYKGCLGKYIYVCFWDCKCFRVFVIFIFRICYDMVIYDYMMWFWVCFCICKVGIKGNYICYDSCYCFLRC